MEAGAVVIPANGLEALSKTDHDGVRAKHDAHDDGHTGDGRVTERIGGDVHAGDGERAGRVANHGRQSATGDLAGERNGNPALPQREMYHAVCHAERCKNDETDGLADRRRQ